MSLEEYAQLYAVDEGANQAARQAASEAGEDKPQGLLESMAAGIMSYEGGPRFQDTARAQSRLLATVPKHAYIGAQAYIAGQSGNAYTRYLRARFG